MFKKIEDVIKSEDRTAKSDRHNWVAKPREEVQRAPVVKTFGKRGQ